MSVRLGPREGWGVPIEHGIESCNFVHPHGWHGKEVGDIVHDANACPSLVLPLCKIEQRNDGRFLVLRWVVGNNLIGSCEVFRGEFKGDLNVDHHVSKTGEQTQKGVANLWVVMCSVPVLSNRKVSICMGEPE